MKRVALWPVLWKALSDTATRRRLLVALAIGLVSGSVCWVARTYYLYPGPGDFLWALRSARDLLAGRDPYAYPVSSLAVPYPLPAAFVGLPFVALPDPLAAASFFGLSSAVLSLGLTRDHAWWRLFVFLSYPYMFSVVFAQWAPLVMASAFFPVMLPIITVKPQNALPVALTRRPRWSGIVATLLVLAVSLVLMPSWPLRWLSQLGPYFGLIPLIVLPGPLLLLALLRWKRRETWLLLLMSVVPQRMVYDQLLLWLIPRTWQEMVALTVFSWLGVLFCRPDTLIRFWQVAVVMVFYLPALVLVLLKRPFGATESPCAS